MTPPLNTPAGPRDGVNASPDLAGALADVLAAYRAAGVPAVDDVRDLNPPGLYVAAPTLTWNRLKGWTANLTVYAVVPAAGRAQSLAALGPLVGDAVEVWPAITAEAVDLPDPSGGDPLPAYRMTVPVKVC